MSCLRQSKGLVSQETVGSVGGKKTQLVFLEVFDIILRRNKQTRNSFINKQTISKTLWYSFANLRKKIRPKENEAMGSLLRVRIPSSTRERSVALVAHNKINRSS